MSDNKFIKHLRGEDTTKSVLEIKNQRTTTSFANMPDGDTSNANDVYSDHRGNATGILKGTENWKLDGQNLVETATVYGDGRDFTSSFNVLGNNLWVDATCTFATAHRFSPNTKFVLKLCGHDLETVVNHTVDFTLIIRFGASNLISKRFTVTEQAFNFCKEFVIDFAESHSSTIKADTGSTMRVQLLCADPVARAVLYNGMTVFTALQRRVDGEVVASNIKTFNEVVQDIEDINGEIDQIQEDIENIQGNIEDIQGDVEDINNKIIVRSATIPTASASLLGKAYQYAGTTNGQYTHNYIYECIANATTYTGIIGFEPTKIAFDYTKGNLAEFFNDTTPNFSQITHGTFTYDIAGDIWTIVGKDSNENVLFSNYKLYTEDLQDAGFVFINPPQDYADGEIIDFEVTFTPQPTTYAWVRVDVQPDRIAQIQALQADITDIQALIPAQASSTNQLGDKNFINSSIATNTANFIGTFNSVAELNAYSGTVTNNDYAFVVGSDSAGNTTYNRYKYTTATTPASWIYEYTLNNSSFTAAQWATINSGVTATDVAKAQSAVQPGDLSTVATTGNYNDLSNKPTIPTVGDGTITITQGGTTVGSFTTNQSNDTTIDLDAGGGAGHNVGDAFLTTRTDNELNGAVECNGATYNTTDFTGAQSIGQLLSAGKVPYVSLATYATLLSTQGYCDRFGWDGAGTTAFRVPTLDLHHAVIEVLEPTSADPYWYRRYADGWVEQGGIYIASANAANVFVPFPFSMADTNYTLTTTYAQPTAWESNTGNTALNVTCRLAASTNRKATNGFYFNSVGVSGVYSWRVSGKVSVGSKTLYQRAMVQLAVTATDEAVETCTSVLADVAANTAAIAGADYVVESQLPTAANNYTWYRKYKSGWVEQGGISTADEGTTISLPITMSDTNYTALLTALYNSTSSGYAQVGQKTTTTISVQRNDASTNVSWEVKGIAA